jgi:hypothetical protein
MRHSRRIALALVVTLIAVNRVTTARAQGGGPATATGAGASPAENPQGASAAGGLLQPPSRDGGLDDSSARTVTPPPSPRSGTFGRVTTIQTQVVTTPQRGVARGGTRMDPRVPKGSTWQDSPGPSRPTTATTRSTTHNYYPGLRRAAGPNANVPADQVRRGGAGVAGVMMLNGMTGGAQGRGIRSGQSVSPGRSPAPGRR